MRKIIGEKGVILLLFCFYSFTLSVKTVTGIRKCYGGNKWQKAAGKIPELGWKKAAGKIPELGWKKAAGRMPEFG